MILYRRQFRWFLIIEMYFSCPTCREIPWSWKFGVLKWTKSKCFSVTLLGCGDWVSSDIMWKQALLSAAEAFWPCSRAAGCVVICLMLGFQPSTGLTFRGMCPGWVTHNGERSHSNAAKDFLSTQSSPWAPAAWPFCVVLFRKAAFSEVCRTEMAWDIVTPSPVFVFQGRLVHHLPEAWIFFLFKKTYLFYV